MADAAQLETALRNADAAGDADAARILASELIKVRSSAPSVDVADVAKSAGIGAAKGAIGLAGLPGDLAEYGARGIDRATRYVGEKLGVDVAPREDRPPTYGSADIQKAVEGKTGEFYKPQTRAGRYAETAGEFIPGALISGPGSLLAKATKFGVVPGIASEAAGEAAQGSGYEPHARVAAALTAPFAAGVARRSITPFPATGERQALVDALRNEGVTSMTAGQVTGSRPLRYAESVLGDMPLAGRGAERIQEQGQRQFTDAALRRAGTGGEAATPDVLAANQRRLGQSFDDLSARNTATFDPQFATDIRDTLRDHSRLLDTHQKQVVHDLIQDIAQYGATMPGDVYQSTRSLLTKQANSVRQSHPPFADALRGIRNALDDVMERSISPADRAEWQATRREYGAQKVLEKTASRAGEATAEGAIVPANLRNTVATENRGAYARGEGPFGELARAGTAVMAPLPNSGTPARLAAMNMMALPGAIVGGPAGWSAAAIGAGMPAIMGRALMSAPAQRYMGNQALANNPVAGNPRIAAIVDALMAQHEAQR